MPCKSINDFPLIKRMATIRLKLITGEHFNARTLATELECSSKTSRRDIDFLRDRMGYEIEFNPVVRTWSGRVPAEPIL
jgi:predicted DNA-binding transcriptional regulator YafY